MITRRLLFRQAAEQNSDAFSLTQERYLFMFPWGRGLDLPPSPPSPVRSSVCSDSASAAKAASLSLRLLQIGSMEGVVLG